ncbi:MAG: hypothetical protein SFW07_03800 [Gammaproteobacteria bacterium]|nr:hypothetical protein [Gammaproteobacteria bacterium]
MQEIITYPYSPITSNGLGLSYSSYEKVGSVLKEKSYGGAKLKCWPNLTTGNLVFQDRVLNIQEANFQLNLRFTYNSRISDTTKAWQFSHKKFLSLPNGNNPGTLQEEDGHLTTYKQDPANPNNYLAQESVGGTKFMRFDSRAEYNCWILHDPETGNVEYYDTNGLLTKKTDRWGRATTYRYENGQLRHIVGPTGNDYEIRYGQNVITIYDTSTGNPLNIYEFDALGRLITSTAHGGYQTKYTYINDSSLLSSVTQTDGTFLGFVHDPRFGVSMIKRGDGKGAQTSRITYADANNPNRAIITDSFNSQTTLKFNNDGDLTSLTRQKGYNIPDKVLDVTQYTYTPTTHQLQDTVLANGGIDHREYNSQHCNLLNNHVYPEGQRTEYVYTSDFETRILLVKNEYLGANNPLTTSYVYERVNDGINLNIFLRFVITPEGRVTEFRPDSRGNIETKRTYLKTTFPKNLITPKTSPDVSVMLKWVSDQESKKEPNAISLEKYLYDTHGQVSVKTTYANVDANGNGIEDAFMGYQVIIHDLFGNLTEHDVKQDAQTTASTLQVFDGVNRRTKAVDALKNATTTEYHDDTMQVTTTYANGKITVAHKANNGLTQILSSSAKNLANQQEYREYDYARDTGGRIELTTRPDGKQIYSFYDRQNRIGYTVSALGIVTEYQYDKQNRFNTTIEYANPIDLSQLQVPPPLIPSASTLINLVTKIKDPTKDHQSYTFFDKSGRKAYEVDADNYVAQYFYDNLNRRIATIQYATQLSAANLATLKSGGVINLPQDFTKDRVSRSFWDNDGLLIGKQDAAGFVTQLVRDAGGRITGKLVYYTKANLDLTLTFDQIIHQVSQGKMGVTYYERDARGQIIAKLNPESYYTEYTYSPNGLRLTAKLYANKPTGVFPSKPAASLLDQLTTYSYDLLGRKIKTTAPFNRIDNIQFDIMGNIILNNGLDGSASQSTDGDHLRQTATQYDGWSQAVNKANVYVGQLLAEAGNDQTKIQQIWANQSQRNKYDQTGLLLSTTDPLGNTTYIYYDVDRRPVLKINANLSIEESSLDSFGKEIQNRKYANFYDMSLGVLTGGFLTPDFQAKIINLRSDLDHIRVYERDKRGNVIKITDAENNISQKTYNAFGQVDTELLPVNSANPTLQIQHGYDTRGNEVATTKTDTLTNAVISESWEFNNPLNKQTKHTNTLGGVEEQEHDLLGNVITEKSNGVVRKTYTHDFIERIATESDAYQNTTTHTYGADHSHTVTSPKGNAKLVSQLNVFEEVVQETDAESNTTETSHAPDGQVSSLVDPLQNKTAQEFDLLGQKIKHVDAILVETAFDYTSVGFVDKVSNDAKSASPQSEKFGRDAFGNAQQTTDPRLTNSKNEFNKNNNLKKTTTDVGGLNLVKAMDYNAQGKQSRVTQTDVAQSATYVVQNSIDGFNRDVGKVVDPTTLKITITKVLDAADNVIRLIDPSGNITRNYFNTLEQKRFRVTATGGLRERFYDENGRIRFKRVYATKVNVTDATTFDQIKALAAQNKSTDDGLLYYFYDENGNEKYRVNSMGFVSESTYNNANPQRVIKTTLYYTAIDPSLLTPDFKTSDLASKITVDPRDRSTFYGRDAKGQVTTKIDGEGYVTAQQFNKLGKPIVVTRYANKLAKPIDPKILPLADAARDRVTYYVYDNLGRRTFQVELMDVNSNKGRVTKYTYDENNNPTQTIKFAEKMIIDSDYQKMVGFLNGLVVTNQDDVHVHEFDKANRVFKKINGLGKYDEFTLDCLGLYRKHKNRNGYEYGFEYDGAKRLRRETSPEVNVVSVAKSINADGVVTLTPTQTKMTVDDTKDYYDNGKIKTVTKGANTNTPRSQGFTYDGMSQLVSTKIDGVNVDDPSKDSSYVNSPTQTQSIETKQVTNAKNLIVAKQDESLRWSFSVYNSEGFEVYAIGTDGSVHQTVRNAFQEVIGEVLFAEGTTLDLSQYTATGIPLNILEADMAPKLNNPKNRVNKYTKNNVGNTVLAETGGPIVYYALVNGEVKCAIGTPVTKFEYNAFKERTYRGVLQYPTQDQKGVWSEEFWWQDKVGNTLAHFNTNGRVDAYVYDDAFHKYTKLNRWAAQLTQRPTSQTTYAQLMSYYQADPNNPDHQFERDYDVIGREIADRQLNAVVQVLVLDPKTNEPTLQNLPPKTLEKKYEWDALDNKVMITYPDGGKECHYFDGRNDEIAQTQVSRTSQDENGAPVLITPLTYFGRDAFRQKVTNTKFKLGTSAAIPSVFPQPLALSLEDQETVKLFDIRGLTSFTSDAEKRVMGHTFTPTRKIARSFGYLTDPMPLQGPVRVSRHIDDIRYLFGLIDKPVRESHYRDNQLQFARLSRYNLFGEIAADGRLTDSGGEDYFSYYDRDPTGKIWRTNSKDGVDTLSLRNLAGYEGLSAQSVKKGLIPSLVYADLPTFLSADTTDIYTLERKQTERDQANRSISTILPGYEISDPNNPQNITMSAVV